MFVLAAGGDPHRDLDLDSVAAERLAAELDSPGAPRGACTPRSARSRPTACPTVAGALARCSAEPELAWRMLRARTARGRARRRIATRRERPYTGAAAVVRPAAAAVAISTPDPRRRVKLPRNLPGGRRLQPYSRADAPFFRSPGFFVRIGGLAAVVGVALCVLVAARLVDPDPPRPGVHVARERAGVPHGRPRSGRAARSSTRRAASSRARPAASSSPPTSPRSARSTRRAGTRRRPARRRSAACPARPRAGADARRPHPPFGRAVAVRAGGRPPAPDERARELPRRARRQVPGLQGDDASRRAAIRRARSAARSSACSARSATTMLASPRYAHAKPARRSASRASKRSTTST